MQGLWRWRSALSNLCLVFLFSLHNMMVVLIVLRRLTLLWNIERAIQGWNQRHQKSKLVKEKDGGWWIVVDVGKGANCQPSHSIGCTTNQFLVKQKACKGKTFDQGYNWQWEFPPPCHVSRLMEEDIFVCYKYTDWCKWIDVLQI